jgi:hypothetical protein
MTTGRFKIIYEVFKAMKNDTVTFWAMRHGSLVGAVNSMKSRCW